MATTWVDVCTADDAFRSSGAHRPCDVAPGEGRGLVVRTEQTPRAGALPLGAGTTPSLCV